MKTGDRHPFLALEVVTDPMFRTEDPATVSGKRTANRLGRIQKRIARGLTRNSSLGRIWIPGIWNWRSPIVGGVV